MATIDVYLGGLIGCVGVTPKTIDYAKSMREIADALYKIELNFRFISDLVDANKGNRL